MASKLWTDAQIRELARQAVQGRQAVATARGEYLRALIGSAQVAIEEVGNKIDQAAQMVAIRTVHRHFYPIVQEATTTPDIKLDKKASPAERKRCALERNRRTNFARSAYGTIRRWLRAPNHDLMKLDARAVTKSQLLEEAPPTRKHALTTQRIHARADRLIDQLVGFAKMVAKADPEQSVWVVEAALQKLHKLVGTKDGRPTRIGRETDRGREQERRAA